MRSFLEVLVLSTVLMGAVSHNVFAAPGTGWVVGKDYLAFWDSEKILIKKDIAPLSHAFDAKSCQLWVSDPTQNALLRFEPDRLSPALRVEAQGRLVSSVSADQFLFLNEANSKLEQRNLDGEVAASHEVAESEHLLNFQGAENRWALFFESKRNRIWMKSFDGDLKVQKEVPVTTASVIWTNPRMLVNSKTNDVWVGFSSSALGFSNSPMVNHYAADGLLKKEFRWGQRGLFFDFCESGEGVLAARDLPTPPYTVPVTSFVESFAAGKGPTPHYQAATNDLVDSLRCQGDTLWMAQRSIFGSQGSYLIHWRKGDKGTGTRLHRLPGSAEKLYLCER